jgi:chemotaxis protein methyltransferase CheR
MRDSECVALLQWALPQLRLKWSGFRKVRRQVCRRIQRRMRELRLADFAAYRTVLETHADEWATLDGMCRITVSRFYRDKAVFEVLASTTLPELATRALSRDRPRVTLWSAGCASGEEPYSAALLWEFVLKPDYPDCDITILGTDAEPRLLRRALAARYSHSALRDMPLDWKRAFERLADGYRLTADYRSAVHFVAHNLRTALPRGPFDMVLCRNLAFTYWDDALQLELVRGIEQVLRPGGVLVVGAHEKLPPGTEGFAAHLDNSCVFRKR